MAHLLDEPRYLGFPGRSWRNGAESPIVLLSESHVKTIGKTAPLRHVMARTGSKTRFSKKMRQKNPATALKTPFFQKRRHGTAYAAPHTTTDTTGRGKQRGGVVLGGVR